MSNSIFNFICFNFWSFDIKVMLVFLNSLFGFCKCWYGYVKYSFCEEMFLKYIRCILSMKYDFKYFELYNKCCK